MDIRAATAWTEAARIRIKLKLQTKIICIKKIRKTLP